MALIHVHALRLWRRGVDFQRHGVAIARDQERRSASAAVASVAATSSRPAAVHVRVAS